ASLPPDAADFAFNPGRVEADDHPGHPAFARSQQRNFRAQLVLVAVWGGSQGGPAVGHAEATDFREMAAGHADVIRRGMGRIPKRREAGAPLAKRWDRLFGVMVVFSLAVNHLSEPA